VMEMIFGNPPPISICNEIRSFSEQLNERESLFYRFGLFGLVKWMDVKGVIHHTHAHTRQ
jgi:hypothetical protein